MLILIFNTLKNTITDKGSKENAISIPFISNILFMKKDSNVNNKKKGIITYTLFLIENFDL